MPELLELSSLLISSPGSLITGDGQLEFNDYLFGDDEITFMTSITGWEDLPSVDSSNTLRPASHGAWVGKKLVGQRIITWTGVLAPEDRTVWSTEIQRLKDALQVPLGTEESTIVVRTRSDMQLAFGTVAQRQIPMDYSYSYYGARVTVQFECSDPRLYSLGEYSVFISTPSETVDGLDYPLVYPLDYGVVPTPNSLIVTNAGSAPSPLTINFLGPMTNPVLVNQNTGERLGFEIVLTADDVLTVNTRLGTVILNGTADRIYTRTLTSSPILGFDLPPGDTEMQIIASDWDAGSGVELVYRDANF